MNSKSHSLSCSAFKIYYLQKEWSNNKDLVSLRSESNYIRTEINQKSRYVGQKSKAKASGKMSISANENPTE